MKKLLILLVCSFWFPAIQAQSINVNVKLGPEMKRTAKLNFVHSEPIGADQGRYLGLYVPYGRLMSGTTATRNYKLFEVPATLIPGNYKVVDTEIDGKDTEFEFMIKVKDKFYLFTSFQNQKLKKHFLFATEINTQTLLKKDKPIMVAEVDYSKANKYKTALFGYNYSPDSSKILINYGLVDNDRRWINFGFNLLDDGLQKIWGIENELPSSVDGFYSFQDYAVSNSGDVYLLCKFFETKSDFKHSEKYKRKWLNKVKYAQIPNYKYTVFCYRFKSDNAGQLNLSLDKKFIRDLKMSCNEGNNLLCTGIFAEEESMSAIGTCLFLIDPSGPKVIKSTSTPFSNELITKGMSSGDAKDVIKEMNSGDEFEDCFYSVKPLMFAGDGSFYLMAEQRSEEIVSVKSGAMISQVNNYHHNDVYIVKYTSDGELRWLNKMPKRQFTQDLDFYLASFFPFIKGDNLYLMYNEIDKSTLGVPNLNKAKKVITRYDAEGTEKQQILLSDKQSDLLMYAPYAMKMNENEVVMMLSRLPRKYQFIKIDFSKE